MKKQRSRTAAVLVAILSLLAAGVGFSTAAPRANADASTPPPVLPALQQWAAGSGSGYVWTGSGRIVVNTADASALSADATTFANDLALDLNIPTAPAVVQGTLASASPGDVFLSLGATNPQLGTEGYALTVAPVLQVNATAATGAFWGTRTILQMLRQNPVLPAGSATDWPRYPVRSVLVDNFGRSFPLSFWHNEIRELSYLKINELMLYVTGLGLTDQQLRDLDAYAAAYHVNLVGQADMPAHMDVANEGLPAQYQLVDGAAPAPIAGALDLTNPAAVAWAEQLFAKYVDLFSTPVWHVGGDEYTAAGGLKMNAAPTQLPKLAAYAKSQYGATGTMEDVYLHFINQMDDQSKQHGKAMRVWNDDLFASPNEKLNKDVTVEYWWRDSSLTPDEIAANGNDLINANEDYLYYNEGTGNADPQRIWAFNPATFQGEQPLSGGPTDPHLKGLRFAVWDNHNGYDIGQLERDLMDRQRAFAQKTWGSAELYPTYAQMGAVANAVGRAPGFLDTPAAGDPGFGGTLSSSQAIVFGNAENTFTVQPDGSIKHSWYSYSGGGPYATETVAPAGSAVGTPTAFASPGQQHVFARGTDGHLHHWVTGTVSGGWSPDDWTVSAQKNGSPLLNLAGDPAGFVYNGIGGVQQQIFGRGSDGHLHHWVYSVRDNTVTAADWGGLLTGDPAPVIDGEVQAVFGRGPNGAPHMWWWQTSDPNYVHQQDWSGPQIASGASPLALAGAVDGTGHPTNAIDLHVFARDTAGHLQHWTFDPQAGTTNVEDLTAATGYSVSGDPSGFTFIGQQHVYFRDPAGHVDHVWTKPGFTPAGEDLTVSTPGTPDTIVGNTFSDNVNNAEQHVFGVDASGAVHHWFWVQATDSKHQDVWQP